MDFVCRKKHTMNCHNFFKYIFLQKFKARQNKNSCTQTRTNNMKYVNAILLIYSPKSNQKMRAFERMKKDNKIKWISKKQKKSCERVRKKNIYPNKFIIAHRHCRVIIISVALDFFILLIFSNIFHAWWWAQREKRTTFPTREKM